MDPFALAEGIDPETPRPTTEPGDDSTAWLLDQLSDPPAAPETATGSASWEPPPPRPVDPESHGHETEEQSRQYGGEAAGVHDPSALHGSPTPPLETLRSTTTTSRSERDLRGIPMRIAIAATEFNYDITSMMLERASAHAHVLGAQVSHVVRVPGVYDLPLAVKRLLARNDVDGVAALGCVIEGETDHDDLVIQHAARKLIDLSLDTDKPVGLGITGPGMTRMQAMARIDRAKDAVEAAFRLHRELNAI